MPSTATELRWVSDGFKGRRLQVREHGAWREVPTVLDVEAHKKEEKFQQELDEIAHDPNQ